MLREFLCTALETKGASGERDLSNCYTPLLKQKLPRKNVNFHLQAGNSLVFKGGVGTRQTTSGFEVEQQKSKGLEPRSDEGMSLVAILISTMSTWHIFHRFWNSSDGLFHIPLLTKRKKQMKGQTFTRNYNSIAKPQQTLETVQ